MSKKPAIHFSDQLPGIIQGLYAYQDLLLICYRQEMPAQLGFSLLDLDKRKYVWEELTFEGIERVGVTHFYQDAIVFHWYEDSQDIEAKSWFALHVPSKEIIWQEEDLKVMGCFENDLYAKENREEGRCFLKDIRTGAVAEMDAEIFQGSKEGVQESVKCPFHYPEEGEDFRKVGRFISNKLSLTICGACDYLEHRGRIIISFYHLEGKKMINQLVVFDGKGSVIFLKKIGTAVEGLGMDTFFVSGERLIFVDHKMTICSYLIG